jgi:hypothetical protein
MPLAVVYTYSYYCGCLISYILYEFTLGYSISLSCGISLSRGRPKPRVRA